MRRLSIEKSSRFLNSPAKRVVAFSEAIELKERHLAMPSCALDYVGANWRPTRDGCCSPRIDLEDQGMTRSHPGLGIIAQCIQCHCGFHWFTVFPFSCFFLAADSTLPPVLTDAAGRSLGL